ncbi:hypothetical protein FT637_19685 [Bacillus cereus]|nr:hypothetical protein [Bacillus cereus]
MDNGTMQGRLVGATLLSIFPLFNSEIVKFHVTYVMLKTKIRNRGIPSWNNYLYYQQSMTRKYKRK